MAKAWEQIDLIATRTLRPGRVALVAGAGPIGMLAALLGVQRGYQVHVFDRVAAGPKPGLVAALGATYHYGPVSRPGPAPGRRARVHRRLANWSSSWPVGSPRRA